MTVSPGDSSQYLGWSLENTSTFVCRPGTSELVPKGCVGELCFGGDQVAAGYLKLPEMTAAKFFEHPEYGRLYRSGDLGRMLPDGSLIILGRIDTQVKLRGLRIELQEIQAIVLRTQLARTCTSMLITSRNSNTQQLALFYVPTDHASNMLQFLELTDQIKDSRLKIQQALQDALPDYMVPALILPVSILPLTSSGKVDNDRLRTSFAQLPDELVNSYSSIHDQDHTEEEWTDAEALIAKALVTSLHVDHESISKWVPFAALGIDSISAMPLARELQTVFKTRVPLSLVIRNPSVGRLAAALTSKASSAHHDGPTTEGELVARDITEAVRNRFSSGEKNISMVLPCTPLQEAMLASSSSETSASYCNQMIFQLQIPHEIMLAYWSTMFRRHEILRTCFMTTDNVKFPIVQAVLDQYQPTYAIFDAGDGPIQAEATRHSRSLSAIVDSGEPPVSLAVIRSNHSEYLSFVCHHAVYDGISIRNLLSEVETLAHHGQLSTPVRFETFLREAMSLPLDVDDFWAQHLQDFQPRHFDGAGIGEDAEILDLSMQASSQSLDVIGSRLKDMSVSLLSLCQSAWAVTISIVQRQNDVCFGNVVSGRSATLDNIDALVAPCFNTLPIRMKLDSSKSAIELTKKFQALNIDMLPYQFTGLRRIQSQLQSPSHLFDTLLILQPSSTPLDETIWTLRGDYGAMDVSILIRRRLYGY
ncbi:putative NRPS-like protein biosynthetic cluster [Diatrype stigma]|uniref:NRPS-like protein biosynthetic cluster n=1 Tax=Diatrype stigma TaxID=117547 RepID=A0AAN9UWD3_9PEZI